MFRRPNLYTSYEAETQILTTWSQKGLMGLFLLVLFLMPFELPVISQIPLIRFLGNEEWLRIVTSVLVLAIASLGLNILAGVGGQVSLGHAFFMGVGACTRATAKSGAGVCRCGSGFPPRESSLHSSV